MDIQSAPYTTFSLFSKLFSNCRNQMHLQLPANKCLKNRFGGEIHNVFDALCSLDTSWDRNDCGASKKWQKWCVATSIIFFWQQNRPSKTSFPVYTTQLLCEMLHFIIIISFLQLWLHFGRFHCISGVHECRTFVGFTSLSLFYYVMFRYQFCFDVRHVRAENTTCFCCKMVCALEHSYF